MVVCHGSPNKMYAPTTRALTPGTSWKVIKLGKLIWRSVFILTENGEHIPQSDVEISGLSVIVTREMKIFRSYKEDLGASIPKILL